MKKHSDVKSVLKFILFILIAAAICAGSVYIYIIRQKNVFSKQNASGDNPPPANSELWNAPGYANNVSALDRWRESDDPILMEIVELNDKLDELIYTVEAQQEEMRALMDLIELRRYFNTASLLSEFNRHAPVTAQWMLDTNRAYHAVSHDDLIKKYGDIFGRQFSSPTTVYTDYGRTASGRITTGGSVAVDRSFVPLGTRMLNLNLGRVFRADDTGGAVIGNITDIFIQDTHSNALRWGRRTTNWIILDERKISSQYNGAVEIVSAYTDSRNAAVNLLTAGKTDVVETILAKSFRTVTEDERQLIMLAFR